MREVLFKAKRKDNGEWVEGYVVAYLLFGKLNAAVSIRLKRVFQST